MTPTSTPATPVLRPPRHARYIGDLRGRYVLASRDLLPKGQVRVLACRARSLSEDTAMVVAPVAGRIGEAVALRFDEIGVVHGYIARLTDDGFVVALLADETERNRLAARIDWVKHRAARDRSERRASRRWPPRAPRTRLLLAGARTLNAFVVDLSCSGAAISADFVPEIGQPLAVGQILARVVRTYEFGFGVRFTRRQRAETLEDLLRPPAAPRHEALLKALALAVARTARPGPPARCDAP